MRRIVGLVVASSLVASITGVASAQEVTGDTRAETYRKLMTTRLEVDFNNNALRDVIDFLQDLSGIDILANWSEEFDTFGGETLDPEAPITLRLNNPTPLVTILELVLDQGSEEETSWSLGEGYIQVGTKAGLNENRYVKIYPVRDLLFHAPEFENAPEMDLQSVMSGSQSGEMTGNLFEEEDEEDNERPAEEELADDLIEIITATIDPFQWELNGGTASIRYFNGTLLVNAPDYLHRQLGGYDFTPARPAPVLGSAYGGPRYVSLTGSWGIAEVVDIEQIEVPILVGGRVIGSGGDDN